MTEQQKVWVGSIEDDESDAPAIYVADTEEHLQQVMMDNYAVFGSALRGETFDEWFERLGQLTSMHWDSYYVEGGTDG